VAVVIAATYPLSAVAALAEVCRREFGVLSRIANVERTRA
jgi:hypothetical protein